MIHINEGEAAIQAKFGQVTVVNRSMELCSIDEELFNCPIQKGNTQYAQHMCDVALPHDACNNIHIKCDY